MSVSGGCDFFLFAFVRWLFWGLFGFLVVVVVVWGLSLRWFIYSGISYLEIQLRSKMSVNIYKDFWWSSLSPLLPQEDYNMSVGTSASLSLMTFSQKLVSNKVSTNHHLIYYWVIWGEVAALILALLLLLSASSTRKPVAGLWCSSNPFCGVLSKNSGHLNIFWIYLCTNCSCDNIQNEWLFGNNCLTSCWPFTS